jgi:hypothetical protein
MIQTADGGYALACNQRSFFTGSLDAWLIKTDAAGNIQWNVTYGGAGWDGAHSIIATSDGGYAIVGSTGSFVEDGFFGSGNMDCWLIKTDSNGNMQWSKTYGGTESEYGQAVIETPDGGFAIAGHAFTSVEEGRENFLLVKTDLSGNLQWNKTYGGEQIDWAYSIVATPDGGYALSGVTSSFGSQNNCLLVKTDSLGNMQWTKTYPARGSMGSRALILTFDGGFALTGNVYVKNFTESDLWIAKTDASGNLEWNQTYNGKGIEHAYALVSTTDGGYAVAGFTTTANVEEADCLLIKTDASGNMQWNKTYGSQYADAAYTMVQTTDGGYALAGSWSYLTNHYLGGSVWLIKTDSEGNTANLPLNPTPTPTASPVNSPTTQPTSTPKPTPIFNPTLTQTPSPTATPPLNQTPNTKLSTSPIPTPTLTPTLTSDSTPPPPAYIPAQQVPKAGTKLPSGNPLECVLLVVAVIAVTVICVVAYNLRNLKRVS